MKKNATSELKQEDLLISKFKTSSTVKKRRRKLIREKTVDLKTTVENQSKKSKQDNTENNEKHQKESIADSADNKIGHPNTTVRPKR